MKSALLAAIIVLCATAANAVELAEHSEDETRTWFDACTADGVRAAEAEQLAQGKVDEYCTFLAAFYKAGIDPRHGARNHGQRAPRTGR
jgi:hypothetical protein